MPVLELTTLVTFIFCDSTMLYTHCIVTTPVMSWHHDKGSYDLDTDALNYGLVLLQIHH